MATLIVPAAGDATRMKSQIPKALTLVDGQTILGRILKRYERFVEDVIVVIRPDHQEVISNSLKNFDIPIKLLFQNNANGTADAVKIALSAARSEVAIVIWGDHIGSAFMPDNLVSQGIAFAEEVTAVFPVIYKENPYVYFKFSEGMSLQSFHETRKSDPVVDFGWNDCGVFFLNRDRIFDPLNQFISSNLGTKDLNFLQILPWLSLRGENVLALKANDERLTLGVNSNEDLNFVLKIFKGIG
jgi:bifunctional N-acetylglucosamine-1-phosphate-uridyltransferase/glucosamine-1-phosphate-acetyltransferase GlmU-like protein